MADKPKNHQIGIVNPKVITFGKKTSSKIFANFYTGTKSNIVECRIDNGVWEKMQWTNEIDPIYDNYIYRWDLSDDLITGKRPSNAVDSPHLWSINIPRKLAVGNHKIEIRATDVFGRTFTETSGFRVE